MGKLKDWLGKIKKTWSTPPQFVVDPQKLRHLAIICDGNRRAARSRGLNEFWGHRAGIETIKGIARTCRDWGVRHLTFWVWSTENWKREKAQVDFIMKLAARFLGDKQVIEELVKNEVRVGHFGRKDRLPPKVRKALVQLQEKTAPFRRYFLNLALDYGGLDETARAIKRFFLAVRKGEQTLEALVNKPEVFLDYLDTADQPLPDLIIRTGVHQGELPHTSGFFPLASAYSCWIFSPVLFPDFTPTDLLECCQQFLAYQRRFGR